MSTTRYMNGQPYLIPDQGDSYVWGTDLSNYLGAVSTSTLQKSGGPFPLSADVDFGPNYGLKPVYLSSRSGAADSGLIRLNNTDAIKWRNAADTGNNTLALSGDTLTYSGAVSATSFAGNGTGLTNVIASALSFVVPVSAGGTGSSTSAAARTALNVVNKGGDQMAGPLDNAAEYVVASAATVDLSLATSNDVQITGTTNISNLGTAAPIGTVRNLRFVNATPASLICGDGSTAGTIGVFQGTTTPGQLLRCFTNDIITVRKFDNGLWYVINQANLTYNAQVWEKIHDWTPGAVGPLQFLWDPLRFRRVRVTVTDVVQGGTGNVNSDFYAQVVQNSVTQAGTSAYLRCMAGWYNGIGGATDFGTSSYMPLTQGGMYTAPYPVSGQFEMDIPSAATSPIHLVGSMASVNNAAGRGVTTFGHDYGGGGAALCNGILLGFATGQAFAASRGSIVIEGLRR